MAIGTPPLASQLPVDGDYAAWPQPWANWFLQVFQILSAQTESGPTANRPTKNLYIGRRFFDTTLGAHGKPIWIAKDGITWVLADGTAA